jgi:2-methylcitrate dehydratase PrpD
MDAIALLSDNIAKTEYSDLSKEVVDNTKKFIIDTIGVGIAGLDAPACQETLETIRHWGGWTKARF